MKAKKVTKGDLTAQEIEFLAHHKISIEEVINVEGMIKIGQKRAMEAVSARISIGGGICNYGHRLKTRSGHCPQCEPKNLAFEKRHSTTAFVYVCVSEKGFVKIGYAADPSDREGRLNRESYASCQRWRLVFKKQFENAGRVESNAHAFLANRRTIQTYTKNGKKTETYEVFVCTVEDAIVAINRAAVS